MADIMELGMRGTAVLFLKFVALLPTPVAAKSISFDCDVPADHFSAVASMGDPRISGSVQVIETRRGNNLPVAGARVVGADPKHSAGFQLVAQPGGRDLFDVVLTSNDGGGLKRVTVGHVSLRQPTTFDLMVSPEGTVQLKIGDHAFTATAVPLTQVKTSVFCSTGQFKFGELLF
jgi:hypothetical protein